MTIRSPENEVLQLTQDLVSIQSHAEAPHRETEVGTLLCDWFRARGVDAKRQIVDGARANVIARVPGGDGPSLMLNGHLDTVPAGDMADAFSPHIRDGVLWGRGACDMKGAVAAMACAIADVAASPVAKALTGDLIFTGTVGEETGSIGVKRLIESKVCARYAVVGEPTSLRIGIAHKGACFVRVVFHGRAAHGSRPQDGVNAVSFAVRVAQALEDELSVQLAANLHPLLGTATVNIGRICGGTQPNIVAEQCVLEIDRRTLPDESDAVLDIERLVSRVCGTAEDVAWSVEEMAETALVPHCALDTSPDSRLVKAAQQVCLELGHEDIPVGVPYWTDGGHLSSQGIETIVIGPGDIAHAHGPLDHVKIEELRAAVDVYRRLAAHLLLGS
jgi:succinyl-diaminopimelate desuccinylase